MKKLSDPKTWCRAFPRVQLLKTFLTASAFSTAPVCMATYKILPTPVKSPADPFDYRALQLDNGLNVVLISDPTIPGEVIDEEDDGNDKMSTGCFFITVVSYF